MFENGLLKGRRVLVTGGGSGLGAAMGRRFLELGADLVRFEGAQRRHDLGASFFLPEAVTTAPEVGSAR